MDASREMLLEAAAGNFDDVGDMKAADVQKPAGAMRRLCLGLAQFTRATKPSLRDPFKQMLAEAAAQNFDDAGDMPDAKVANGECLSRIALGLAQLSRAMKGL